MRAEGLMRGRELNIDMSHSVVSMVLKVFTVPPLSTLFVIYKEAKASFKNYIFNNNFQATLDTNMLPNA